MDLPASDADTWLKTSLVVLSGLLVWIWNRIVRQLDSQKLEIDALKEAVAQKASAADVIAVYGRITLVDERTQGRFTEMEARQNEQHVENLEAGNAQYRELMKAIYERGPHP